MRAALKLLSLFSLSLSDTYAFGSSNAPAPFPLSLNQPSFLGEPIAVKDARPTRNPYWGDDCIRLELLYAGRSIHPSAIMPVFLSGLSVGSSSIVNELACGCIPTALYCRLPEIRLPLHIWSHIKKPCARPLYGLR